MIVGTVLFLVANGAVALGAREITARMASGRPSVDFLAFLLVRLALISATLIAAGILGVLTPWGLGGAGAFALAALALWRGRILFRLPALPRMSCVAWVAAGVLAGRYLLQAWVFAPHLGDAVAYHLPKIAEWVRAGAFTREMGLHPHVTFPAGFELIETWWVVFWRHDVLIEMAGAEFLLLGLTAVAVLARRSGLSRNASVLAAASWALVPGAYLSALSCLNDTPAAALTLAVVALVAARAPWTVALLAVGLGAGTKATMLYTLPGWMLLEWLLRKQSRAVVPARWCWTLAALGLTVGSFWYARNLFWYGNPIYPVGEPGYASEPVAVQAGANFASIWGNLSDLVEHRIYDYQAPLGPNVDHIAGWGAVVFSCGLPGLLLAVRKDRFFRSLAAVFVVSLVSVFLLSIHDPWSMKYVFFFPALLCLGAARVAEARGAIRGVLLGGIIFCFVGTFLSYDLRVAHARTLLGQPWSERTAAHFPERSLPDEPIGCFGGFTAFAYHVYGPDFGREVVYLRPENADDLVEAMERRGLRILYAAPVGGGQQDILDECLRRSRLRPLGERLYVREWP